MAVGEPITEVDLFLWDGITVAPATFYPNITRVPTPRLGYWTLRSSPLEDTTTERHSDPKDGVTWSTTVTCEAPEPGANKFCCPKCGAMIPTTEIDPNDTPLIHPYGGPHASQDTYNGRATPLLCMLTRLDLVRMKLIKDPYSGSRDRDARGEKTRVIRVRPLVDNPFGGDEVNERNRT